MAFFREQLRQAMIEGFQKVLKTEYVPLIE
jgi:hypothetical protein